MPEPDSDLLAEDAPADAAASTTPATLTEDAPVAPETTSPPEPEKRYVDWRDALRDADPDELVRDDRIAGRIGQVADKIARDLVAKRDAAADAEHLRKMRDEDPYGHAEELRKREAAAAETAAREQQRKAMADELMVPLNAHLDKTLPAEVKAKIQGKDYRGGSYGEAMQAYLDDIVQASVDHAVAKARATWEKDERPALKKQVLNDLNGGDGPEAIGVSSRPGRTYGTETELAIAYQNGEITQDEMVRQYRAHRWR